MDTSGPTAASRRGMSFVVGATVTAISSLFLLIVLLAVVGQLLLLAGDLAPEDRGAFLSGVLYECFGILVIALWAAWGIRTKRRTRPPAPPE